MRRSRIVGRSRFFPTFTHPAFAQYWWGPGGNPVTQELLVSPHAEIPVNLILSGPEFDQAVIDSGYVIDLRRKNIGGEIFSGLDFDLAYRHQLSSGNLTALLGGTYMLTRDATPAPGTPAIDKLWQAPRLTGRLSLLWNLGPWNANAFVNYTGSYDASGTDAEPRLYSVSKFVTTDLQLRYDFETEAGLLSNLQLNLDVRNVLDEEPPFVLTTGGFAIGSNGTIASPLGRFFMLGVTKK